GKGDGLPETVLAMLQARVLRLDSDTRLVLRAASIFNDTFCVSGLRALLGDTHSDTGIGRCLEVACDAEIIKPRPDEGLAPGPQHKFRHALLPEASSSLLTERDRRLGHRLAADQLVTLGEVNAAVIAEHYRLSDEPVYAVQYYLRAAEQSFSRNDLAATQRAV